MVDLAYRYVNSDKEKGVGFLFQLLFFEFIILSPVC